MAGRRREAERGSEREILAGEDAQRERERQTESGRERQTERETERESGRARWRLLDEPAAILRRCSCAQGLTQVLSGPCRAGALHRGMVSERGRGRGRERKTDSERRRKSERESERSVSRS